MQINKINNNSVNFGMKCSPRLKMKIANCFPDFMDAPCKLFKNSEQLANEIDIIGSKNTSLEKFNIKRHIGENFYDGTTEIWDECRLLFRMLAPSGKQEKVSAKIRSALSGEPWSDIHKDFIDITKMAEEEFLSGYMGKQARKGKLKDAAKGLLELYPEHTEYICREFKRPDLTDINNNAKMLNETSTIRKIISFFTGE